MVHTLVTTFFSSFIPFSFLAKESIIQSEERPAFIYYLSEGIAKQSLMTARGQELCLNLYKPGSFFPLMDTLTDIPNAYTFSAFTLCHGWRAPAASVKQWLRKTPEVSYDLNVRLLKGMNGLLRKTAVLMQGNARVLVVHALLMLNERFPLTDSKTPVIMLPITHQKLADLTGLSRETVTRELAALQQSQLITLQQHIITILDEEALIEYVKDIADKLYL